MVNENIRALSARKELDKNLFSEIASSVKSKSAAESLKKLAAEFLLDESVVFASSSFYDFLKEENREQKVHVCNGTACMTAGTQDALSQELAKHFKSNEIGHASCLGHCHSNSAFMLDGKTYSANDPATIAKIVAEKPDIENKYRIGANGLKILTGDIAKIEDFYNLATKFAGQTQKVIAELKDSKLRGRGGAGFPFWFKLDSVSKEDAQQKYIVCNADEGDPGAYSDMYLLEKQAHKVLFGMYISGLTVGADTAVLYIRGEYPASIRNVEKAIEEINDKKLAPNFRFKVIRGQGSYVCGEETALLNSIEGLRPEVRVRPPYPSQAGLYGKPTVLSNVETFANIHWILDNSGEAFANIGTADSSGTKLVSLDGHFKQPGIYEIEMGTELNQIINDFGQGFKTEVKAIQIGGPLGGIIPLEKFDGLSLDFESLSQAGFLLGHASFVSIPKSFPMIKYLEHLLKFTADESCGKCYPCRIGSFRGYEMIQKAQNDDYKIDRQLFEDLLETLELGSLCALGGGVPLPIRNSLEYFESELRGYFDV